MLTKNSRSLGRILMIIDSSCPILTPFRIESGYVHTIVGGEPGHPENLTITDHLWTTVTVNLATCSAYDVYQLLQCQ